MAKTVLIVDDADIIRLLASRALKAAGYDVLEALNGIDALALLDSRTVDMVVCDFSMPVMNGIEFVKSIKSSGKHRSKPVLMLTVADEEEIVERAKMAGVNAWMSKPFNPAVLVEAVNKLCR